MALSYTQMPVLLGNLLRISRKREAAFHHMAAAAVSNSDLALLVASNAYSSTVTEDKKALDIASATALGNASALLGAWTEWRASILRQLDVIFTNDLPSYDDEDRAAGAIEYEYSDTDGVIAIVKRRGIFGRLYHDMNLAANAQYVTANAISFGTFTAEEGNRGATLTVTGMTGASRALTGTLVFECVDESVRAPKFSMKNRLSMPVPPDLWDAPEILGDNLLRCERQIVDGQLGLTITLTRPGLAAPSESGDGGAMFSSSSVSTPSDADTDHGKIYITVRRDDATPTWIISWYRDSSRSSLVQRVTTTTAVGSFTVDMTGAGGTRFQSTFDRAAANTALTSTGDEDSDIVFDIQTPRLRDRFTRTITNDEAGLFSTKLGRLFRADLPVSGSTAWTDSNASSISMS